MDGSLEYVSDNEVEFQDKTNFIPNAETNPIKRYYYANKSKRDNIIAPWSLCELLGRSEPINGGITKYLVRFEDKQKDVAEWELASALVPSEAVAVGGRIIAQRRNDMLPYRLDNGARIKLIDNNETLYYPGLVAGYAENRYLVFFDDGCVQYCTHASIRRVQGNHQWHYAHWNAKAYFEFYLKHTRWEFRAEIGKTFKIELNGDSEAKATVTAVDAKLAQVHFDEENRFEWIYSGSPRIYDVFRKLMTLKRLDSMISFKTYNANVIDLTDDVVFLDIDPVELDDASSQRSLIPLPPFYPVNDHECSERCVEKENEADLHLERYTALQRSNVANWYRFSGKPLYYRAPCGRRFHSMRQIDEYLLKTNSKLRLDCFDFTGCEIDLIIKEINDDISRGVEAVPINICDEMSLKDRSFNYIKGYRFDDIEIKEKNNLGRTGCNCTDGCRDKTKCSCWKLTIKRLMGKFPTAADYKHPIDLDDVRVKVLQLGYVDMKLLKFIFSGLVECSDDCSCCRDKCVNRVVQNGLQHKLELFMTEKCGWGVKTTYDIPEGAFVCDYAGDMLDIATADRRVWKYQFRLPKFDVDKKSLREAANNESDLDDVPVPKRIRVSYDVEQPFLNYFPLHMTIGNAVDFADPEPVKKPSPDNDFVVDGMHHGNISRFINHSCEPNLFVQSVFTGNDSRFPRMAFFAVKKIERGTELSIDYRYEWLESNKKICHCGSKKCRGRLT